MQPSMRSGVLTQVREVGQHEVDAEHVDVGEHQPAVEEHDPAVDLDARAVPADLPQAAEERDGDRRRHQLDGRRWRTPRGRGPRCQTEPDPTASRHSPAREAERAHHRLGGLREHARVAVLVRVGLEQTAR